MPGNDEMTAIGTSPAANGNAVSLHIWHCSHPRTASNVLAKQFRSHPQLAHKEYPFYNAYLHGPERLNYMIEESHQQGTESATYQKAFNDLQQSVSAIAKEGKHTWIKEHMSFILDPTVAATKFPRSDGHAPLPCPKVVDQAADGMLEEGGYPNSGVSVKRTNPSILPDAFMRTLSPIFQIRHPAISIPSYYRAGMKAAGELQILSDGFSNPTSYAWDRVMFDWYCEHAYPQRKEVPRGHKSWPLIVEGEDLVNDNERTVSAICSLANIDVAGVAKEWQPVSDEVKQKQTADIKNYLSTLQDSKGVIKSGRDPNEVSIEEEHKKWEQEFGADIAGQLKHAVQATMDDYLFLAKFKI
ncbi:MAG: hypothetical protein Q9222_000325 [Ikaeria aurantiellina]